jgi:hypothetical protein
MLTQVHRVPLARDKKRRRARQEGKMNRMLQDRNKAMVLAAFDTLFKGRDYAPEQFWSPDYIQHSAHIVAGREGVCSISFGAFRRG